MSRESSNGSRQQPKASAHGRRDIVESPNQKRIDKIGQGRSWHKESLFHRAAAATRYLTGPFSRITWLEIGIPSLLSAASFLFREDYYSLLHVALITGVSLLLFSPYFLFKRVARRHGAAHFALTVVSLSVLIVLYIDPLFVSRELFDVFNWGWLSSITLLFVSSVIAIPLHIIRILRRRKAESQRESPSEAIRSVVDSLKKQLNIFNEAAVQEQRKLADALIHIQKDLDSRKRDFAALDDQVERLRKKAEKYDEMSMSARYFRLNIAVGVIVGCLLLFIGGVLSPLLYALGESIFDIGNSPGK